MFEFISITVFAALLKLSSSVDDAIWLAKLVHGESRSHRGYIETTYVLALVAVTIASYLIYLLGDEIITLLSRNENVLPIVSSIILIIFSLTYLRKDHSNSIKKPINYNSLQHKVRVAFTISVIGSIDELLLFVTVLSTGKVSFTPLLAGTVIAAGIIIILVSGITRVSMVMSILKKIPIWIVIFSVGAITLVFSSYTIWKT